MASAFVNTLVKNVTNSATTLFTASASTQHVIIGLSIANTTTSSITMDVYITRSAVDYYLIKGASIAPGNALIVVGGDQKVVMVSGDVLKALSGTATSADASINHLDLT